MVKYGELKSDDMFTLDFSSNFIAPEVPQGNIKYENDIYSLCQMIYYIISDKCQQGTANINDFNNDSLIYSIYSNCVDIIEKRPSILDLMYVFYICFNSQINMQMINKDIEYFHYISINNNEYITRNIHKAIHYYSLAANQNHPDKQFNLGGIYDTGKYIKKIFT